VSRKPSPLSQKKEENTAGKAAADGAIFKNNLCHEFSYSYFGGFSQIEI
jgi:hypothetical protein